MAREGSKAFKQTMTTMSLEVPLFTLAQEFAEQTEDLSCLQIYQVTLGLEPAQAQRLCQGTKYFSFGGKNDSRLESAIALLSVYLYGDSYDS